MPAYVSNRKPTLTKFGNPKTAKATPPFRVQRLGRRSRETLLVAWMKHAHYCTSGGIGVSVNSPVFAVALRLSTVLLWITGATNRVVIRQTPLVVMS